MSAAIGRMRGLFVAPAPAAVTLLLPPPATPSVAVLCPAPLARSSAAAVALALARLGRRPFALAAAWSEVEAPSALSVRAARQAAARLRASGVWADAGGRLVWVADRCPGVEDPAGAAAAGSVALARAAAAVRAPAALALPLTRTDALDRVLAWHDGIVVVREPADEDGLGERVMASVAALGRPVACMPPLPRGARLAAECGMVAPAAALAAVARLGVVR